MPSILDNLTAILIGTTVLLMLVGISVRLSQTGTDQQVFETSQRVAQSLAQQLEGDLPNVGYGVPRSIAPIVSWTDSSFAFRQRGGLDPDDPILVVEYRRVIAGTVIAGGAPQPVYRVERYENGARIGGSPTSLASFELDLLDASGTPTALPEDARAVRVRFAASFLTRDASATTTARFDRTFHPLNLAL
ncbi:MAG: hypothetical protein AAGI52_15875 [Bacteroidota bacterium]